MKHSKILAMILSVCMVLGIVPVMAGAETFSENNYVYYGNNNQKWIVADDADMLLLADSIVEEIAYNGDGLDNTWANSDAKAWCDSYASTGLSAEEQSVLTDGVSFLSKEQAELLPVNVLKASTGWWLSTPSADNALLAYAVSSAGLVGCPHIAKNYGARPAVNVDESKIVMICAAVEGKNTEMDVVAENASNEWKLTVVSDAYSEFEVLSISLDGRQISVTFAGAATGENEQVSAMLKNTAGDVLAYGPISTGVEAGTVSFTVPQQISGNLTVGVFNEKLNGDKTTDLSSEVTTQNVTVVDGYGHVQEWGLNLNDSISANFKMNINTEDENATVQITVNGEVSSVPVSEVKANDNYVSVDMAAAQMTDTISVQVVDSNGQGGAVQNYTIRDYADYLLANSTNDSEKALVKAMLNYGGKSQVYFEYHTERRADTGIDVSESTPKNDGLTASVSGSSDGVSFYGASMLAVNKTMVRFYFDISRDIEQYSFVCNGKTLNPVAKDGKYYVMVEGMSPADLNMDVSVIVNGELTVTYSPLAYMQRMYHKAGSSENLKDFVKAMYTYYLAAEEYISNS